MKKLFLILFTSIIFLFASTPATAQITDCQCKQLSLNYSSGDYLLFVFVEIDSSSYKFTMTGRNAPTDPTNLADFPMITQYNPGANISIDIMKRTATYSGIFIMNNGDGIIDIYGNIYAPIEF